MGYAALRAEGDVQARRKPVGGFTFITGTALLSAWWTYRGGSVTLLDLRVWLACFELVARRCGVQRGRPLRYTTQELMTLTASRSESSIRRSIGRLRRSGLLVWSASSITVGHGLSDERGLDRPERMDLLEEVINHARRIPVPRRIVRLLAREGTKVLIATAFGHLLRCLYYRQGRCRPSGMCKASWVAEVFGVDIRNVKAARQDLIQRGMLTMERRSQWFLNRYGPVVTVNLEWGEVGSVAGRCSPPPHGEVGRGLPPLRKELELLRIRNQKPLPAADGLRAGGTMRPGPNLRHVIAADLVDPARLEMLHAQAREAGYVNGSAADRLNFFAAAAHALAVGLRNPPGLFAAIVRGRQWRFLTLADEDAGRRNLKAPVTKPLQAPGICKSSGLPVPIGEVLRQFCESGFSAISVCGKSGMTEGRSPGQSRRVKPSYSRA